MSQVAASQAIPQPPLTLTAELTHRCPLGCPYCCNPLSLERADDELDTATWVRIFGEAATLGVRHVHLSGGEPGLRRDLVEIAASAREAGVTTHLVTSGVGISTRTMRDLWEAGLHNVKVSIQDADARSADRIAGCKGAFQRKHALAAEAVRLGLGLTVSFVVHRANIERLDEMVGLALALKASRVEIAGVRYLGWALKNRPLLMPTPEQMSRALAALDQLRQRHRNHIAIDTTVADGRNACAGEWECDALLVTPSGKVLPCDAAECVEGLEPWNVRDRSLRDIWTSSPVFKAFRAAEGPICPLSAFHDAVQHAAPADADQPYEYRADH